MYIFFTTKQDTKHMLYTYVLLSNMKVFHLCCRDYVLIKLVPVTQKLRQVLHNFVVYVCETYSKCLVKITT